eukprot:7376495-Prymnesium_polylepis.2
MGSGRLDSRPEHFKGGRHLDKNSGPESSRVWAIFAISAAAFAPHARKEHGRRPSIGSRLAPALFGPLRPRARSTPATRFIEQSVETALI